MTPSADHEKVRAAPPRAALAVKADTEPGKTPASTDTKVATTLVTSTLSATEERLNAGILTAAYIGASTLLVLGLSGLLKPTATRRGMAQGMVGTAVLIVVAVTSKTLASAANSG